MHFFVVALVGCSSYSLGLPHTSIGLCKDPKSLVHYVAMILTQGLNQSMAIHVHSNRYTLVVPTPSLGRRTLHSHTSS